MPTVRRQAVKVKVSAHEKSSPSANSVVGETRWERGWQRGAGVAVPLYLRVKSLRQRSGAKVPRACKEPEVEICMTVFEKWKEEKIASKWLGSSVRHRASRQQWLVHGTNNATYIG